MGEATNAGLRLLLTAGRCGKRAFGSIPPPRCTLIAEHVGIHCDEDEGVWFAETLEPEGEAA